MVLMHPMQRTMQRSAQRRARSRPVVMELVPPNEGTTPRAVFRGDSGSNSGGAAGAGDGSVSSDLLRQWAEDIARFPLLSLERERLLLDIVHAPLSAGYPKADRDQARHELVCANLRLVLRMAMRYEPRVRGSALALVDLVQYGNMGLMRAVEKFDRSRYPQGRFSTYAVWWIRQAITRGIAEEGRAIRVPVHTAEELPRIRRLLADRPGLSVAQIADAIPGLTEDAVAALVPHIHPPASLDAPVRASVALSSHDEERLTLGSLLVDERVEMGDPLAQLTAGPATARLTLETLLADDGRYDHLAGTPMTHISDGQGGTVPLYAVFGTQPQWQPITARERATLVRYYGLDRGGRSRTLSEVGDLMGITRERVRQILVRTIAKLQWLAQHEGISWETVATVVTGATGERGVAWQTRTRS